MSTSQHASVAPPRVPAPERGPGEKLTDGKVRHAFEDPYWDWELYGFKAVLKQHKRRCKNIILQLTESPLPVPPSIGKFAELGEKVQGQVLDWLVADIKLSQPKLRDIMLAMILATSTDGNSWFVAYIFDKQVENLKRNKPRRQQSERILH
ncbi:hypothetical protein TWF718_009671 [Orbilia javanica]|uniref:Uncharacterized protein n=1 Tax=Orbilia javanica TaxID=47235 RepID=A0AAN8RLL4_9PEZI